MKKAQVAPIQKAGAEVRFRERDGVNGYLRWAKAYPAWQTAKWSPKA